MPLQERLSHAAAVAKWKADQQMRLFRIQNQISGLENKIRSQKALLADTALALYAQERLSEDELKQICAAIAQLHEQIRQQQQLQEAVRQERPPEPQAYSVSYPPSSPSPAPANEPTSGLVCPQCGRSLAGRFCPEHGLEGIQKPQSQSQEGSAESPVQAPTGQLVCPVCQKPLSVRFCPEHGAEGVPTQ